MPSSAKKKLIEERLLDVLKGSAIYDRPWLAAASAITAEVRSLRLSIQRLHRRAQRAEKQALIEGRRADELARRVRALLTREPQREHC
jgi:hypothetical protein